jgi:hypothetical protein
MVSFLWLACAGPRPAGDGAPTGEAFGSQHLVRLTHVQWENSVVALLHLDGPTGWFDRLVPDPAVSEFDVDAEGMQVDPVLWQQYQSAAEGLGLRVVTDEAVYAALVPVDRRPEGPRPGRVERDAWVSAFADRAFRGLAGPDEIDGLTRVFEDGARAFPSDDPFRAGVRATVTAALQSPSFLYRTEGVHTDDPAALGPEELAARLAFALWNAPPDDALADVSRRGLGPDALAAQVDRMLAAPQAHATVAHLHRQLLHVDGYESIWRPSEEVLGIGVYELSTPASMQREVLAYVDDVVFGGGTVADLLTRRRTFVDERLAGIYGLSGITGDELVPVELPPERAGLLTLSGFLAWQAGREEPNLIGRGGFVNDLILCADIPPPGMSVPPLPPPAPDATLRERIEAHTTACGSACHAPRINPIGFAYGRFDFEGRFDPDPELDTTGTYPFEGGERSFDGAVELAHLLAAQPEVHRCYAEHLLGYLEGRVPGPHDEARLEALTAASLAGRPIRELVVDIVTHEAFRAVRP